MSQQHKALLLSKDATRFTLGTRTTPKPGLGEVLVKNMAVALNPVDAYIQKMPSFLDVLGITSGFPALVGFDGAGVVQGLGEGATNWQVGDKVFYQSTLGHYDYHTFQEYTLTHAARIAKIPHNLTFDEAASIPLTFATAAIGLYSAHAEPGSRSGGAGLVAPWEANGIGYYSGQPIIVTGGASSVGQFAIQLAKLSSFNPIITTASAHNVDYCKAAGATHVIDYKQTPYSQLAEAVSQITSQPFKVIYDSTPSEEVQRACWDILAPEGTLVVVRAPVVGKPGQEANESGKRVERMFASVHEGPHVEMATRMYAALSELFERGSLKPNRVELLPGGLAGIPDGLERIVAQGVSGVKLIARPTETP